MIDVGDVEIALQPSQVLILDFIRRRRRPRSNDRRRPFDERRDRHRRRHARRGVGRQRDADRLRACCTPSSVTAIKTSIAVVRLQRRKIAGDVIALSRASARQRCRDARRRQTKRTSARAGCMMRQAWHVPTTICGMRSMPCAFFWVGAGAATSDRTTQNRWNAFAATATALDTAAMRVVPACRRSICHGAGPRSSPTMRVRTLQLRAGCAHSGTMRAATCILLNVAPGVSAETEKRPRAYSDIVVDY